MPPLFEVYRTTRGRSCRHRALVLASQGVPFHYVEQEGFHCLLVEERDAARAVEELRRYEEENRGFGLAHMLPPAAVGTRAASAGFVLLLVGFGLLQWTSAGGIDWLARGAAHAAAIRSSAPWLAATALLLHADLAHLLANLVFGTLFATLVFHAHGGGLGALAILVAGVLGNVTNAWIQAPDHVSIGASTAVFGATGILCGSEWRRRHLLRETRARRLAPVGVALLFLLYLGVGEIEPVRRIDVLAHVFGLCWGLVLGAPAADVAGRIGSRRAPQLVCALAALALVGLAWGLALQA